MGHLKQVPGEQDLPFLDAENLALIQTADQQIDISAEELVTPGVSRILATQDVSNLSALDLPEQLRVPARPIEATPAVKTQRELPGTPQKPKRKQRDDRDGGRKKLKNLDAEEKGSGSSQQKTLEDKTIISEREDQGQQKADSQESPQRRLNEPQLLSPELTRHQPRDWVHMNTSFQLTPMPLTPSPIRKRQPHKLIIDETLQLTRNELKQNMTSSKDTSLPLKVIFSVIRRPSLQMLWSRNCKFGLRVSEYNRESSPVISPLSSPRFKRKESTADFKTPAKLSKAESMLSGPASIERGRDTSAISAPNESRERSKSFIGQASDDSTANISADQAQISTFSDHGKNLLEVSLAPLPEEQEQIISPGPLQVPGISVVLSQVLKSL
ncbi:hypothetical protein PoB_001714200 [Plakobranchus ocellatus]|uniref:Uncharacterized protein n=1 Tax=Plakobranchus ocellatus TaxID=259542 RepID=A0AAV3Z7Y7_9GAST|nr:hypothetical protein PoB_001714200 [Plakobranchus ocellatus]